MYTYDFAGTRESAHCKREAIGLIRLETVGESSLLLFISRWKSFAVNFDSMTPKW